MENYLLNLYLLNKNRILIFALCLLIVSCESKIDNNDFIWTVDLNCNILHSNIALKEIKDSILIIEAQTSFYEEYYYDSININSGLVMNANRIIINNKFNMNKCWRYNNIKKSYWEYSKSTSFDEYITPNEFKYELIYSVKLDNTRPLLIFGDVDYFIFKDKKTGKTNKFKLDFEKFELFDFIPFKDNCILITFCTVSKHEDKNYVSLLNIEKLIDK